MTTEQEVVPGLALHLDSDELEDGDGSYTCTEEQRVRSGHFFLCLPAVEAVEQPDQDELPMAAANDHPDGTR